MTRPRDRRRALWGWALYDWANSAFATTVMAGFFPLFFKGYWNKGVPGTVSTARLGLFNSLACLLVVVLAPVLGAIADRGGLRKRFLMVFAYLGVLMTAGLFVVREGNWLLAAWLYVFGVIGFSLSNVFYDALLPVVSDEENRDRVSALGFSMGYLGGGLLFAVNVAMTLHPEWFGLTGKTQAVRVAFLSVAAWWGCFTVFCLLWVPGDIRVSGSGSGWHVVTAGLRQLLQTCRKLRRNRVIFLFLLSYWFYIDGVDTIIKMAVDYGMSIGFTSQDLIVALLVVQFVGFPAALVFGRLGERWGARKAIYLGLSVYCVVTLWGATITRVAEFYLLAVVIGLVQGGVQALSRSYYSRLIPEDQTSEFFGLYNMMGRFAAVLGPTMVGLVGLLAKRMLMPPDATAAVAQQVEHTAARYGIASILALFIVGMVLFHLARPGDGKRLNRR